MDGDGGSEVGELENCVTEAVEGDVDELVNGLVDESVNEAVDEPVDESVKVARRYDRDNWFDWECRHASYVTPPREKGDSAISDSYSESDYSLWTYLRQEERDKAITLTSDVVDRSFPGALLEDVSSIILREE